MSAANTSVPPGVRRSGGHFYGWLAFVMVFFVVGVIGYGFYLSSKESEKKEIQEQLHAVGRLKSDQVARWLKERNDEALTASTGPMMAESLERWQAVGDLPERRAKWIAGRLERIRKFGRFTDVKALGLDGRILLTTGLDGAAREYRWKGIALQAIREKRPLYSPFYRLEGSPGPSVALDIIAPLTIEEESGSRVIGAMAFQTDPGEYLFPLIQSWPTSSPSAETLLAVREGDEVLFLNELRHRKGTALTLRMHVTSPDLIAAKAARGEEGVAEGVDYRNVPVLADIEHIPGTPWFLVSKVDQEEVYAPLREYLKLYLIFLGTAAIVIALSARLWWKRIVETGLRREKETAQRYLNVAGVLMVVLDTEGRVVLLNRKGLEILGYPEGEVMGRNWFDLCIPADFLDEMKRIFASLMSGDQALDEYHVNPVTTAGGEERTLAFHNVLLKNDKGEITGVLSSGEDITERVRAEADLRRSETKYRVVADNTYDWEFWTAPGGEYIYSSPSCARITGYDSAEFIADPLMLERILHPEDRPVWERHREETKRGAESRPLEFRIVCRNGEVRWIEHMCQPVYDREGVFLGMRGSNRDVTERKGFEEERERLISELREALANVKTLSGFLPICASCKKIRDDKGYWEQIEAYIQKHSDAEFSHGICPDCAKKLYPEIFK